MPAANPTEDGLTRLIGSLNEDYGLGIRPLGALSSSVDDNKRVDDIYKLIRVLHFTGGDQLSSCLGRFRTEAHRARQRSVWSSFGVTTPGPQSSTADKGALQCRLLEILSNPPPPIQTKQSKRLSDGTAISRAKRPKSRDKGPLRQDVVDELPVRTRISPSGSNPSAAPCPKPEDTIKSYFPSASTSMQTLGSSRPSFVHSAFSSGQASALASSDTTLDDDFSDDAADANLMSNEQFLAFAERFESRQERHIESFLNSGAPQKLEERLKCTWPKQLDSSFNEAPLAVVWEVTRFLQHCGVEVAEYGLSYDESNERWHTQSALRAMHINHGPFAGKGLPPASQGEAWTLGLKEFQSKFRAVILSAELVHRSSDTGPFFDVQLKPLKLDTGHRLCRRFGADRFLEVIMPLPLALQEELASSKQHKNCADKMIRWLAGGTHYFLGRRWTPFFTRELDNKTRQSVSGKSQSMQKVYFFATDGNIFRMPDSCGGLPPHGEALTPGTRTKMGLHALLEWAIAIQANLNKPIPKLFARLALSLSRTLPTVVLDRHQIICHDKNIGTHETMNDGIGLMSLSLAKKIASHIGLTNTPSAFQARLGSAKGMWIIDVDDDDPKDNDWIATYPSQVKWDCAFEDPHHRCFEVMSWSHEVRSASLNQQFIPVLEAQALDPEAMRRAIKGHLENDLITELCDQKRALDDAADLRLQVQQSGGSGAGYVSNGYVPFLAGLPKNDEDAIAYLLDAGFHPKQSKYILDLFYDVCKRRAEHLKNKTHVRIPQSAYLLMVADFTSTLEEGEVQVSFSSSFEGGDFSHTLLAGMDILVGRAPAHLPSDMQRVRAVSHPKLQKLKDVIVFSTKGKRPLADLLCGGDYDGDRAYTCWDRDIVNNFRNAAVPESPDLFKMGYLSKFDSTVADIGAGAESSAAEMSAKFVYLGLCFNMNKKLLGQCTRYKERLCYRNNTIRDDAAIILSNLVGHLVDQGKQGTIFEANDWDRLRRELLLAPKSLDDPHYFGEKLPDHNRVHNGNHILDFLKFSVAEKVINQALEQLHQRIQSQGAKPFDADLTKMYNRYEDRAKTSETCKRLLGKLRDDIKAVWQKWQQGMKADYTNKVKDLWETWLNIEPAEELMSSDLVFMLVADRDSNWHFSQWNLLKASATFKEYFRQEKFTWRIAGQQLCYLKHMQAGATSEKAAAIVHPEMWAALRPNKKFIKARRAQQETAGDSDSVVAIDAVTEYDDDGQPVDDV